MYIYIDLSKNTCRLNKILEVLFLKHYQMVICYGYQTEFDFYFETLNKFVYITSIAEQ